MEFQTVGSNSSVWGSAMSHVHLGRRTVSEPESRVSKVTVSQSGQNALITGSRDVVCKTPAEFKANKLNRNEQTKLESITVRVVKEQEIARRKFSQSERMLRAKSASIVKRIQTLESSSYVGDKRPKSEQISRHTQSSSAVQESGKTNGRCTMCEKIQRVIQLYEKQGKRAGILAETDDHSTCLFSDVQMKTFICMLEAKYFRDIPDISGKLRESGVLTRADRSRNGNRMSREEINNCIAKKNVELRIQQFCKDLEVYKKTHSGTGIPKEVQDKSEKIRLENAVLTVRQIPSKHEQIRREVEEILGL